jgi:hypothetical protein
MYTTTMPGFSGENSIFSKGRYSAGTGLDSGNSLTHVQPALPNICDGLAELVWSAYNEGAYNTA